MKIAAILGVMVLGAFVPSAAWAGCGHSSGSYNVSCESGVKVYRHQAKDLRSVGLTANQTKLKIAKMQQETQRQAIAASRATARENAALRSRQIDNQRFFYRRATTTPRYGSSRYGYNRAYGSRFAVISRPAYRRRGLRSRVKAHH